MAMKAGIWGIVAALVAGGSALGACSSASSDSISNTAFCQSAGQFITASQDADFISKNLDGAVPPASSQRKILRDANTMSTALPIMGTGAPTSQIKSDITAITPVLSSFLQAVINAGGNTAELPTSVIVMVQHPTAAYQHASTDLDQFVNNNCTVVTTSTIPPTTTMPPTTTSTTLPPTTTTTLSGPAAGFSVGG